MVLVLIKREVDNLKWESQSLNQQITKPGTKEAL